jgi:Ser/Thr protein kinase RdoA (MazF antagonist)
MSTASLISGEQASSLAAGLFGVHGVATALKGERDQNFLISGEKDRFVLKITNPAEDRSVTDFHTQALLHVIKADPTLSVPHIVPTVDGATEAVLTDDEGISRVVRLLSFLPGVMAATVPSDKDLRCGIGCVLARFDLALGGFSHPAASYELSWDLAQASRLRHLLPQVEMAENRRRAEAALDAYDRFVEPALRSLRKQIIHNDLNPYNVFVSETPPRKILGVIDFGDMIHAPLVNDLAIASSYHVGGEGDALQPVCEMVEAYNRVLPLEARECDLLYDLIVTRLAMTVLITEWRARRFPENKTYILKNHPAAVQGLARLADIPRAAAQSRFRSLCGWER